VRHIQKQYHKIHREKNVESLKEKIKNIENPTKKLLNKKKEYYEKQGQNK
jgi:hypothetical protein